MTAASLPNNPSSKPILMQVTTTNSTPTVPSRSQRGPAHHQHILSQTRLSRTTMVSLVSRSAKRHSVVLTTEKEGSKQRPDAQLNMPPNQNTKESMQYNEPNPKPTLQGAAEHRFRHQPQKKTPTPRQPPRQPTAQHSRAGSGAARVRPRPQPRALPSLPRARASHERGWGRPGCLRAARP